MADGFDIDFSELDSLVASFERVPRAASKRIRQAVEVTARHVKDDWADQLKGARNLPAAASSIDYDIKGGEGIRSDGVEAEVGANLGKSQGPLVGILEYGSPTIAPRGYGLGALQKNSEDFEKGLTIALEQAEKEAGL